MPTTKSRKQRGSRTHGGGSHKKRRGAGHRGGRGRAGRTKHEKSNYPERGKSGFKRPASTQVDSEIINLREIDEDVTILVEEGIAEELDDGYRVDVRDIVADGHEADTVKVLAQGQVHNRLELIADDYSSDAKKQIKQMGGKAFYTGRGIDRANELESVLSRRYINSRRRDDDSEGVVERAERTLEQGTPLGFSEFQALLDSESVDPDRAYGIFVDHAEIVEEVDGPQAIMMFQARDFAQKHDRSPELFQTKIDLYFEGYDFPDSYIEGHTIGLPDDLSVDDVLSGLDYIHEMYDDGQRRKEMKRTYLRAVDNDRDWV